VASLVVILLAGAPRSMAADAVLNAATASVSFDLSGTADDNTVSIFIQRGPTIIAKIDDLDMRIEMRTVHKVPLRVVQTVTKAGLQHGTVAIRFSTAPPDGLKVRFELEMEFLERKNDSEEKTTVKQTISLSEENPKETPRWFSGSW
jgi:hypothetical protein